MSESSGENEVGLVPDEDLPEDLQPSDDNPLAQDPEEGSGDDAGPGGSAESEEVDGMPDMGEPGAI